MNKEMKNELAVTNTSTNEIVLYQPNETIQLEVRLQDETVWLNQQQIAVLFGTQRQAITKHLKNIFESGELERQATCSILELVQKEGNRMVHRNLHRRDGLSPRCQHQGPWQEVVRLQPHGNAHNRTVAKNAQVEYNNLIFGS